MDLDFLSLSYNTAELQNTPTRHAQPLPDLPWLFGHTSTSKKLMSELDPCGRRNFCKSR